MKNKQFPITWTSPKIGIKKTKKSGRGVFSLKKIKRGEKIAVFGGHIIPYESFKKLPVHLQEYPFHIDEKFLIGCISDSEISKGEFFNHSCNPNSGFDGQTFLVALRDISVGEQICFDYSMCMTSDILYMKCYCGEKKCRGIITGNDWKIPRLQKEYKGYFQPYINKKIKNKKIKHG